MQDLELDDFAARLRRDRAISALLPLFFVSGATSLVYQTVWARELNLVFGTSTFAIATVLTAFMGGLAIGGFTMARFADRIRRPLRVYGLLEVGIGLYALAFPSIVDALEPVYLSAWRALHPPPVAFAALQLGLIGAALLLPTAAMGATLPLLARFATDRLGAAGDRIGRLYGVNTFGAVVGTWLAGFVLLPQYGLFTTTAMAASANLALGLGAVLLSELSGGAATVQPTRDLPARRVLPALPVVAVAMGLAGFASLVYEVAWFRLLGLMLGASVYAFSTMLLAFLVGIAIGGTWGGRLADGALARGGTLAVLRWLAALEVGVALLSFATMYLYPELPFWYVWLFDRLGADRDPWWLWATSLTLAALVMTPPALCMGAAFPAAVRAVVGDGDELGGPVGRVYGANTLGAVGGAALAGFVLLPTLGVQGAVLTAAACNLLAAAGLVAWSARAEGRPRGLAIVGISATALALAAVALRPPWDPMIMTAGMYHYVSSLSERTRAGVLRFSTERYEMLYYAEGPTSVVTVAKNRKTGNIWLANNGKVDASTSIDMPTQVLCALLPFQFVEAPTEVLVIGLASGVTAGAATTVDGVERFDVVEIEPAITEAARLFAPWNHDVVDNERVHLIANDGRNHLLLTPPGSYDVIVSEPSNPWITGVSNLFTREFFEMGKARLKPGGVWSQWVQLYGMDEHDVRSLLATFADTYAYVLVYATIEEADLVMIGSDAPIEPSPERVTAMMDRWPRVREELASVEIHDALDLVTIYQMDRGAILDFADDIARNTDDNMRIEYSAPLHLHASTTARNFAALLPHSNVPIDAMGRDPVALAALAERYYEKEQRGRAILAMGAAAVLAPRGGQDRAQFAATAIAWRAELDAEVE